MESQSLVCVGTDGFLALNFWLLSSESFFPFSLPGGYAIAPTTAATGLLVKYTPRVPSPWVGRIQGG